VAQKLVDEGVAGVIGHLNSGATIPASKIYSDNGIPQISPSATAVAYTASGFKTAYRVMTNDAQQGSVLGNYAVTKLGAKKIAIIDDRTAYGRGWLTKWRRRPRRRVATWWHANTRQTARLISWRFSPRSRARPPTWCSSAAWIRRPRR